MPPPRTDTALCPRIMTRMSSVLAMAKDLVMAQIRASHLPPDAMHTLLQETYAHLMALKMHEEGTSLPSIVQRAVVPAPVSWKKSLTKHTVACLECGASFKQLSVRHLKQHDLDPQSSRAKYGIPRRQPLAAKAVTARRTQLFQQHRPWEKAPTYLKAQARKAAAEAHTATPRRTRPRPT
jgi:predicted transcriptional regulator